jgi:hypothetical protein
MEHLELEAEMAGIDQLEQRLFARTKMLGGGGGLAARNAPAWWTKKASWDSNVIVWQPFERRASEIQSQHT